MRTPKLCVTVTGGTTAELRKRRDEVTDADLIELRVDTVRDPSAAGALSGRRTPVIFTCRPTWEGGHFAGSEEERQRILDDAHRIGAEYIDVEWNARLDELIEARRGSGVIVSMHDFDGTPHDLDERVAAMRATGAEVIKISVMAHRLTDCLPLRTIGRRSDTPIVVVAMGECGIASRVLASQFGSSWTYGGDAVAPGQISVRMLRDQFNFDCITDRTAVYGVVGRPVGHSLSPAMHNAAFKAVGINATYLPLAAADFADFLAFADAIPVVGASVTAPFKGEAFRHAADVDDVSERTQSVNTLQCLDGRWTGRNTDVAGFLRPLQPLMQMAVWRATILGAGGAARGVAEALVSAGASVSIAARHAGAAEDAARLTGSAVATWPPLPGSWDLLVNATPIGTAPDVAATPLPDGAFTGDLVYDLVYNPPETRLLRDARAAGCRTLGGLEMLVAQAELQFEWWTGVTAPAGVMRDAALAALGPLTSLGA
jgi:3-dehydroquinate dehydratase/shikimate dehydrogenase